MDIRKEVWAMLRPPPERVKHRRLRQPRCSLPQCQNRIPKCGNILWCVSFALSFSRSIDPYTSRVKSDCNYRFRNINSLGARIEGFQILRFALAIFLSSISRRLATPSPPLSMESPRGQQAASAKRSRESRQRMFPCRRERAEAFQCFRSCSRSQ
jgi:hypothetical protein